MDEEETDDEDPLRIWEWWGGVDEDEDVDSEDVDEVNQAGGRCRNLLSRVPLT